MNNKNPKRDGMTLLTLKKYLFAFISLIFVSAAIIAVVITTTNDSLRKELFLNTSYYLILTLFILWLYSLIRYIRSQELNWRSCIRSYGTGLVFSFILAGIIFISVRPHFRILADETNILAVSQSMTFEQKVENVTMGKWYYFNFQPLLREIPKRSLLFPFFTHLLHVLRGYHPENAFALNFLVLASLFGIIFYLIRKHLGTVLAFSCLLLIAAQPIVSITATSGCSDLLTVTLLFLSFIILQRFLKNPSKECFEFLWLSLLMLAHVRYETPIFFFIIILSLLVIRKIRWHYFKSSFVYALTPLTVLPIVWQRMIQMNHPTPFQEAEGSAAFSIRYLLDNIVISLKNLLSIHSQLPYAILVNWAGSIALVVLTIFFILKRWPRTNIQRPFVLISSLCLVGLWLVVASYYFGTPNHPTSARFYIAFNVILSILPVILAYEIPFLRKKPIFVFLFALSGFILYHPVSIEGRFTNASVLPRQYRITLDFIKKHVHPNALIMDDRPGMYTVHNYGSINFHYANNHKEDLQNEYNRHLYPEIIAIQEIDYDTRQPIPSQKLDKEYRLRPIFELQNNATSFIRISQVTPPRASKPRPPS